MAHSQKRHSKLIKCFVSVALVFAVFASSFAHSALSKEANKPKSQKPQEVIVRGFAHNTFGRVIFKVKHNKDFIILKDNDVLSITFKDKMIPNVKGLADKIKKFILTTEIDRDGQSIHLLLTKPNVTVRRFYGKGFVGVDIIAPKKIQKPNRSTLLANAPKPTDKPLSFVLDANDELQRLEKQLKKENEKSLIEDIWSRIFPQDKPSFLEAFFLSTGSPKTKPINPTYAAEIKKQEINKIRQAEIAKAKDKLKERLDALRLARQDRMEKTRQELADQKTIKREGITRSELEEAKRKELARLAAEEAARRERILTLEHGDAEEGIKVIFPWTKPVAAVFYARGHHIWAVFNKPIILETDNLKNHPYFTRIDNIKNENYTAIRFTLNDVFDLNHIDEDKNFVHIKAIRVGTAWEMIVEKHNPLEEGNGMVSTPIAITINGTTEGVNVFLAAKNPVLPFTTIDSEVGDIIHLIPLYESELGVGIKRDFVDFTLPPTAQGIVILQKSDDVVSGISEEGLTIASNKQLNISRELFNTGGETSAIASSTRTKISVQTSQTLLPFNFQPFLKDLPEEDAYTEAEANNKNNTVKKPKETREERKERLAKKAARDKILKLGALPFFLKKRELHRRILKAEDEDKTAHRLDLAKYLFSMKLYHESLGMLLRIKNVDPIFEGMQEVDIMIAASHYLLRQYRKAKREFTILSAETKKQEELKLWKWMSDYQYNTIARKRTPDKLTITYSTNPESFMGKYPPEISFGMTLQIADFQLSKSLLADAQLTLTLLDRNFLPNDVAFLEGRIQAAHGNVDEAIAIWEQLVSDTEDRKNRAHAIYELAKIRLINGIITPTEAIEQFNIVGSTWRGDILELDVLKLIGQLYIREGEYVNGLRAWKLLVANFPHTKEALFIAGKMKQTFIKLFDEGEAYNLKPFNALALYFEFRELTPVGDIGDRISQQLAEHFINADLLSNAADIISHQIRFRTKGDLKHLLTLKLAKLYLLDKEPVAAINAIAQLKDEKIRPSIAKALRYEEARGYLALGEYKTTLQKLWNDFSPEAQTIRINIFWAKRNWFGVMDIIEPRLPAWTEKGRAQLNESEMEQVMKLAIAYRMQEEFDKILALKAVLKDQINSTKLESSFNFVTSKMLKLNFEDFDNTVQLEEIEDFLLDYTFWPSKDWKNIAQVLSQKVKSFKKNIEAMTDEDRAQVVRLALSYAMQMDDLTSDIGKTSKRSLSELQRDFKSININQTTIRVLSILDKKFEPKIDDEVFSGKIPLKELPTFIPTYNAAERFSELNEQL